MATCPACGRANPAEARYCMACGTPQAAAVGVLEERRVITVLFADLAGFTARAEALDPEDVRAFLVPYYGVITSEVTAHGGRVDRYLGDGVMAIFGAPVAHEDDAERAVRAALRIAERVGSLGLDLHVRLGINTGPVLFASAADGRDDGVTGDAVNTAARLQEAAPLDAVVVGEATYRATAHALRYAALLPVVAKGKASPVALWRALGPIAPTAGVLRVEATPFVGRDVELALLVALFERARATPSLEVATIVGDAGLGKSRLVRELAGHVNALPGLVTWRVGRCLPYGDGMGLWALGEIVKAHAGIGDGDDQAVLSAKLDAVLEEPDPSLRAWMRDRLAPLVGLAVNAAPPRQEEAFAAWSRFLEAIARRRPTVLVLEDLHWAGEAMMAFLEHLAEHCAGLPLLIVATARPDLAERHPGWLARSRHGTVVSLAALSAQAMEALVRATLPRAKPDLVTAVVTRAEGSPLYAEQLAAVARDRLTPLAGGPDDDAFVPPGLEGLLAARLDALPADARTAALDASVVGRTFWAGAVAALGGRSAAELAPALAELVRRELVRPVAPSMVAGDVEYTFWHALLRDTAYRELTRRDRLTRHRATAAWLLDRVRGTSGDAAPIVVSHLDRALELANALGRTADAAEIEASLVPALVAAADQAMRTQASRAPVLLRRALALMDPDDPSRADVLARLGRAHTTAADFPSAVAAFDAAAEILEGRGDDMAAAELAAPRAVALVNAGSSERAARTLDEAIAVLEGDPGPAYVSALAERAHSHGTDRHPRTLEEADRAIAVAASLGQPAPHRALAARAMARWESDPSAARDDMLAAIAGAVRDGELRAAMVAQVNLAGLEADYESVGAGVRALDNAIAFAAAHGLPAEEVRASRVAKLVFAGEWTEVVREADELLPWARRSGDAFMEVRLRLASAYVRLERGEAIGDQADLADLARDAGWCSLQVAPVVAGAALATGDGARARRLLADALDASRDGALFGFVWFVRACLRADAPGLARRAVQVASGRASALDLAVAEAMVAEASGALEAALGGYERVAAELARLGDVPERVYAVTGLGRCLLGLGEPERGAALLRDAREAWERLGAVPRIAEVDALLTARTPVSA